MSDLGWAVTGVAVAGAPHMVRDGEMGRSCPFDLGESIRPVSGERILLWTSVSRPVPSQPSNQTHLCRLRPALLS